MPLGPYILCALSETRSMPSSLTLERHEAGRLHGIAVEQRALRVSDGRHLRQRVEHADFVVCRHRADEQRIAREPPHAGVRDRSALLDRRRDTSPEIRRARARGRVEDGAVLGGNRDDVAAARRGAPPRCPLIARLFDSVAPLVKTTSRSRPPMSDATCSRACSTALPAFQPNWMVPA